MFRVVVKASPGGCYVVIMKSCVVARVFKMVGMLIQGGCQDFLFLYVQDKLI